MQVGDLVKIVYDGSAAIVTEIEIVQSSTNEYKNTWVHLLGEDITFKKDKLEVISENRRQS